jgi:hypothetical protein
MPDRAYRSRSGDASVDAHPRLDTTWRVFPLSGNFSGLEG